MGELLGKFFDRTLYDAGSFRITFFQFVDQLLLRQVFRGRLSERVFAGLPQRLSPFLDDVPKCALARFVADEPVVVAHLDVVTVDRHAGQSRGPMRGQF